MTDRFESDRLWVMAHMHHTGSCAHILTAREWCRVWLLADGFGTVDREFAMEQSWDWSHVRDSSPEAIERMAAAITKIRADNPNRLSIWRQERDGLAVVLPTRGTDRG